MCVCMCVCIPETLLHLKLTQYYKLTTLQLNIKQKIFLKRCKEKNFKYQKENHNLGVINLPNIQTDHAAQYKKKKKPQSKKGWKI